MFIDRKTNINRQVNFPNFIYKLQRLFWTKFKGTQCGQPHPRVHKPLKMSKTTMIRRVGWVEPISQYEGLIYSYSNLSSTVQAERYNNQWSRIGDPEIDPHTHTLLIFFSFCKIVKAIRWRRDRLFKQTVSRKGGICRPSPQKSLIQKLTHGTMSGAGTSAQQSIAYATLTQD